MGRELTVFADMRAQLLGARPLETASPEDAAREIMMRIMEAKSVEDALSNQSIDGWQDYIGQPVILESMKLNSSTFEEGPACYGVFSITVCATGERKIVTCGATNVLAQAIVIGELGGYPVRVRLVESGRVTVNGFRPCWLEMDTAGA